MSIKTPCQNFFPIYSRFGGNFARFFGFLLLGRRFSPFFSFFFGKPLDGSFFFIYTWAVLAGIAQLVEHDLAKVGVEGPSPFSRSSKKLHFVELFLFPPSPKPFEISRCGRSAFLLF
jgi:hypothetical protein